MTVLRTFVLTTVFAVVTGAACAQPGGGRGMGPGAGPMGAGPSAGPVRSGGPETAGGTGAQRWGPEYTPGWALMTEQERNEHRERMRAMTSYEECKTYQEQHHERMAARSKERGGNPPTRPPRDACAGLQK